ncbi:hypothetical protein QEH42_gp214 [Microbacterium phage Pumpernickel]|uniref:Uncharacterized protein n=1 Tax=Microbacterium phage Pumpernickel TaxID=2885983 RepID=A0AAE8YBP0_9CAUD|nr:hypothetical protein QEH42_gp214 [Microbacterium phage Pumpernickel]UDL16004.1 hypothetical protein SEA_PUMPERNICKEL_254 [Microbacterium phage Pumpernickel]
MHTPEQKSYLYMPLNDHEAGSLDELATRVYGQTYKGQQTGDMLPNDSWHVYEMDKENVADWVHGMKEKRHYLGLKRVPKGTGQFGGDYEAIYHEGHNAFEYWLSLRHDPVNPDNENNPQDGVDHFGQSFKYEFQVYREAPEIHYVLADLIDRGELPYGTYLLHCWW